MTTATVLIQAAFREGNLIAAGATPTTNLQTEALARLNSLVTGVFGYEIGENLEDWLAPCPQRTAPVAANFPQAPLSDTAPDFLPTSVYPYPPKNRRIVWGGTTQTVYFPENPMDGSRMAIVQGSGAGDGGTPGAILTLDGNGRTIEGSNTKTYTNPATARAWFYRADTGNWIAVTTMVLADECPFPAEFDDFFICALSKRLAPRFGKVTAKETVDTATITLKRLKARYRQAGITVYGSENYPNSSQSFGNGNGAWWW
jgi:hypothetical protein